MYHSSIKSVLDRQNSLNSHPPRHRYQTTDNYFMVGENWPIETEMNNQREQGSSKNSSDKAPGLRVLACVSPYCDIISFAFRLSSRDLMSTFAQDSPVLYLFPRVIIKKISLFTLQREGTWGKKLHDKSSPDTYFLFIVYLTHKKVGSAADETCVFCSVLYHQCFDWC